MIVLGIAGGGVLAGIGLAFFIDWGGHRRLSRRISRRTRQVAMVRRFADTKGPSLVDDLAGRVKEIA